jgi:hypothetical protein
LAEPHRSKRRSQPISRHPLFPAIVALWFAALLGLGSFALRPAALEAMVLAGHLDALVPAAAPPLGMTARMLLALVLGVAGGAIGWMLAKRAAAASARPAPQVLRMAEVGLDETLPWPGMAEEPAPQLDPVGFEPPVIETEPEPAPAPEPDRPGIERVESEEIAPAPTAAERIAAAELDSLSHVELVERLAIALQRRRERRGAPGADDAALGDQVVRFPGASDRQGARLAPPAPAAVRAPAQTEKALREALATLQRMSGSA